MAVRCDVCWVLAILPRQFELTGGELEQTDLEIKAAVD